MPRYHSCGFHVVQFSPQLLAVYREQYATSAWPLSACRAIFLRWDDFSITVLSPWIYFSSKALMFYEDWGRVFVVLLSFNAGSGRSWVCKQQTRLCCWKLTFCFFCWFCFCDYPLFLRCAMHPQHRGIEIKPQHTLSYSVHLNSVHFPVTEYCCFTFDVYVSKYVIPHAHCRTSL